MANAERDGASKKAFLSPALEAARSKMPDHVRHAFDSILRQGQLTGDEIRDIARPQPKPDLEAITDYVTRRLFK